MKYLKYLLPVTVSFFIGCGGGGSSGSSNPTDSNIIELNKKLNISDTITTASFSIDSNSNLYLGLKDGYVHIYHFLSDGNLSNTNNINIANGIDKYTHLLADNNRLIVFGNDNGLNIYDITDINTPTLTLQNNDYYIKTDSWTNPQENFILKDNFLIGTINNKLLSLDINNTTPTTDYSFDSNDTDYSQISIANDNNSKYLFDLDTDGLNVFDMSNPSTMTKLSTLSNINLKKYNIINDSYIIGITNNSNTNKLTVLNVSDKNNITLQNSLKNIHTDGDFLDYFIDNETLYALSSAGNTNYLDIYNISDLNNIKLEKTYELSKNDNNTALRRIFKNGNFIYLFGEDSKIYYFNKDILK